MKLIPFLYLTQLASCASQSDFATDALKLASKFRATMAAMDAFASCYTDAFEHSATVAEMKRCVSLLTVKAPKAKTTTQTRKNVKTHSRRPGNRQACRRFGRMSC